MATVPVTFSEFGGLNLDPDPLAVGPTRAVNAVNVLFDRPGRLRTRPGYTTFGSTSTAPQRLHVAKQGSAGSILITDFGASAIYGVDATGALIATKAGTGAYNYTNYGSPTVGATYTAVGGVNNLVKWDGAAFTALTPGYGAYRVALNYNGTRLVLGNINNGANPSQVRFSDAGAPETFGVNNFVELTPGDNEGIRDMVRWRDMLFVFKDTKFFVFYGESIDSTGNPVFNYRTVDVNTGTLSSASSPTTVPKYSVAVATPNGVYFTNRDGVYVTTGDAPVKVSGPLDPWFQGQTLTGFSLPTWQDLSISYSRDRLYLNNSNLGYTLVGDVPAGWWTLYDKNIPSAVDFISGQTPRSLWAIDNVGVFQHRENQTTDNGTAIAWSYLSGKYPLDQEQRVAITRESSLFGAGTVTLTLSSDRYADQSGSVTLGTAAAPIEGWLQKDQEGRYFQHTLSGSGIAMVATLTHNVSTVKPAGIS